MPLPSGSTVTTQDGTNIKVAENTYGAAENTFQDGSGADPFSSDQMNDVLRGLDGMMQSKQQESRNTDPRNSSSSRPDSQESSVNPQTSVQPPDPAPAPKANDRIEFPDLDAMVEDQQNQQRPGEAESGDQNQNPNQQQPQNQRPNARVLDGLPDDLKKLFTQMSNPAYAALYPLVSKLHAAGGLDALLSKEAKYKEQLDAAQKGRFYEHPEAYRLSEDFQIENKEYEMMQRADAHLEQQLAALEAGQPVYLLEFTPKGGAQISATPEAPGPATKARIMSQLMQTKSDLAQQQGRLSSLQSKFRQEWSDYEGKLGEIQHQIFGDLPKKYEKEINEALELFPAFARHRAETRQLAASFVIMRKLVAAKRNQEVKENATKASKEASRSSGPTVASLHTAPNGKPTGPSNKLVVGLDGKAQMQDDNFMNDLRANR